MALLGGVVRLRTHDQVAVRGERLGVLIAEQRGAGTRPGVTGARHPHLERNELPKADQSHVLGRTRFEHLLLAQETLTTPVEELERMAEEDLARNKAAYEALNATVSECRPIASGLLGEVRQAVDGARGFMLSPHS